MSIEIDVDEAFVEIDVLAVVDEVARARVYTRVKYACSLVIYS